MPARRHLRIVSREVNAGTFVPPGPLPTSRVADRLEPWPVSDRSCLTEFANHAVGAGIALELAARLVIERQLISETLANPSLLERLDDLAATAKIERELDDASAAYLRALCALDEDSGRPVPGSLALPLRLRTRLGERPVESLLHGEAIAAARAWERAALLCGYTMSEWAAFAALKLTA